MTRPDPGRPFVSHPRYGKRPRITGLNPREDFHKGVYLHWHSSEECRIPDTAIQADSSRQAPATMPVTHYFDARRVCRDCERPFIFFAEEQKHWYEELRFPLEADAVRCPLCRKRLRQLAGTRKRYERLFHVSSRSLEETLEMADCCLALIEAAVFHHRQTAHVRMLLNRVPEERRRDRQFLDLTARLHSVEMNTENVNVSVHAKVTNLAVADTIDRSFNRIEGAQASDDLKQQLQDLHKAVAEMTQHLSGDVGERAADDLEVLTKEAVSEKPRRKWYELSGEGLVEAAKSVGEAGVKVIPLVRSIMALLA